jgi:hypothetical protein
MNNYNEFINQQVINKNNEVGVIVSFDNEHVVVKYQNITKTYKPDVAFNSGFLTFKEDKYNELIHQDLSNQKELEEKKKKTHIDNNRKSVVRRKRVTEVYKTLLKKSYVLKSLFGSDFVYPPLKEFEEKYKGQFDKDDFFDFERIFIKYSKYHYYYYY